MNVLSVMISEICRDEQESDRERLERGDAETERLLRIKRANEESRDIRTRMQEASRTR